MRVSAVALVLGAVTVAAPIVIYGYLRHVHEEDVEGISRLREELDSTRAVLALATTAADSARLADDVRTREYWYDRLQFHVPLREERLAGWWKPTGFGTLTVTFGMLLIVIGLMALRRRKRGVA